MREKFKKKICMLVLRPLDKKSLLTYDENE